MKKIIATILLSLIMSSIFSSSFCEHESIKKQFEPMGLMSMYTLGDYDSSDYGRALLTYLLCFSVNLMYDSTVNVDMSDPDNVYKIRVVDDDTAIVQVYTNNSNLIIYYTPTYESFVLFFGWPDSDNKSKAVNAMYGELQTVKAEDFAAAEKAFFDYIEYLIENQ